jgi:hypothetical protein
LHRAFDATELLLELLVVLLVLMLVLVFAAGALVAPLLLLLLLLQVTGPSFFFSVVVLDEDLLSLLIMNPLANVDFCCFRNCISLLFSLFIAVIADCSVAMFNALSIVSNAASKLSIMACASALRRVAFQCRGDIDSARAQ